MWILLYHFHRMYAFLDYSNLFSLNDYKKDDKIKYMYFKDKYVKSRV